MYLRIFVFSFSFIQLLNLTNGLFGIPKMCLCRCGVVKNQQFPDQYPWLALINTGSEIIEGALITDEHVLTVASRLYRVPFTNLTVTLGVYDRCGGESGLNSKAASIALNPAYSPTNLAGDLAIIKLRYPVAFNNYISPVCLPYLGLHESGSVGYSSGYQFASPNSTCIPRLATFPFLDPLTCLNRGVPSEMYTADKGCFGPVATTSNVCALDVGAPVMWRWADFMSFQLIGIVSIAPSCEQQITPLYTRVLDHISWIHDVTESACNCF